MQCCFCIVCNSAWHHAWLHGFLFVCLFVVLICVVVVVTCYYMSNENGFQSFHTLIYLDENCFENIHYNVERCFHHSLQLWE